MEILDSFYPSSYLLSSFPLPPNEILDSRGNFGRIKISSLSLSVLRDEWRKILLRYLMLSITYVERTAESNQRKIVITMSPIWQYFNIAQFHYYPSILV